MKLGGCREDRIVAELTRGMARVGDDCAIIGGPRDRIWQLLKTDAVVEGVHFLAAEKPERIGWKALCRAISDIAAMAGTPLHALITVAAPATMELAWLKGVYKGLRKAARRFGVEIVGGETVRSPGPFFLSIALAGEVERRRCVTRDGGRAGDVLFVTGRLGGSLAGQHLDFIPRVTEAQWLAKYHKPTAMMDLSDGLGADLPRLARMSRCGYEVALDQLPLNKGCTTANGISDGEDYELLFAISPEKAARLPAAWRRKFPRVPVTRIGVLTPATRSPLPHHGHDHFAQS